KYNLNIDRSTVSKILGQCDKWKAVVETECSNKTFRHRSVKFPLFNRAINLWVENVTAGGVILTDLLIKEKARYFAKAFKIPENELVFSNKSEQDENNVDEEEPALTTARRKISRSARGCNSNNRSRRRITQSNIS
ncbi:19620_t:CDS:2, partial [Funneliformis geosporum]